MNKFIDLIKKNNRLVLGGIVLIVLSALIVILVCSNSEENIDMLEFETIAPINTDNAIGDVNNSGNNSTTVMTDVNGENALSEQGSEPGDSNELEILLDDSYENQGGSDSKYEITEDNLSPNSNDTVDARNTNNVVGNADNSSEEIAPNTESVGTPNKNDISDSSAGNIEDNNINEEIEVYPKDGESTDNNTQSSYDASKGKNYETPRIKVD